MYHIRVDTSRDNPFFAYLETISDELLISSEKEDTNPHCHILCETSVSPNSLRMKLKRLGFTGNKSYSISAVRKSIIEIGAYLVKDSDILRNSYDPFLTQLFYDYDASVKDSLSKKTKKNTLASIISTIPENVLKFASHPGESLIVQQAIIDYHLQNDLLIRRFQCKTYYDTIVFRYAHPSRLKELVQHFFS